MEINWLITFLTSLTIFFASIVHGIAGFGLAQVGMGILPLFRSPESAAIIFSMVAVVSNLRVWWSVRAAFNLKEYLKPVIGLSVGMPLGIYFFNQMNTAQVKTAIGITLVVAAILIGLNKQTNIMSNWFKNKNYQPHWVIPIGVGLIAGILGGAVAIPGPPMILYGTLMVTNDFWTTEEMKAIFTAFFGSLMLYRVLNVAITGSITFALGFEALIAIPPLLLGSWIGIVIFKKLSNQWFNWLILGLLFINALILLLQ